jgi:hypothetical protein
MANPTAYSWVAPTKNTDGSAIGVGEITGYSIGQRPTSGTPGTYTSTLQVSGAATLTTPITLGAGSWTAAIQTVGPTDSAFSSEISFVIAPPVPVPPTGFGVA